MNQANNPSDKYLEMDEFSDVQASLTLLSMVTRNLELDPHLWKWAIISSHLALQSACVCILTNTDGNGSLDKKSSKELSEYHKACSQAAENKTAQHALRENSKYPVSKIANLPDLLIRLPDRMDATYKMRQLHKKDSLLSKDLARLHEFRCQFVHFSSTGWYLEKAGLPRIVLSATELTNEIIMSDHYNRVKQFDVTELDRLFDLIIHDLRSITA